LMSFISTSWLSFDILIIFAAFVSSVIFIRPIPCAH
jgi:uncharacterized membrane protein